MSVRHLVLGLLNRAPMHGYEMQKVMEQARVDVWAGILPGSLYHALKKMDAEGLIKVKAVEQSGFRQKAVYEITKAGKAELAKLLAACWDAPSRPFPVPLYLAMTFLEDKGRALPAIERRISSLETEIARWNESVAAKGKTSSPLQLAMENLGQHLELDLQMLRRLQTMLKAGSAE